MMFQIRLSPYAIQRKELVVLVFEACHAIPSPDTHCEEVPGRGRKDISFSV
jgi:hypothetical protein